MVQEPPTATGEAVTSSKTMPEHSLSPVPGRELPTSKVPTPLGALSILPRELRDKIYGHLCDKGNYFDGDSILPYRRLYLGNPSPWYSMRDMATLSTTIRREFLAILHADAVFNFWVPIGEVPKRRTRDEIPFCDQIKNVRWAISLWVMSDTYCMSHNMEYDHLNRRISGLTAGVSLFTGADIARKSCVVELQSCTPRSILILQSPFFDGIKLLTGFMTVKIELSSWRKDWCPEDALTYGGGRKSFQDYAVGFRIFLHAVRTALEPSLGPSVLTGWHGKGFFDLAWHLTFHPSDYVLERQKTKAGSGAHHL